MHMKSSHAEDNADQRITGSTRQHIISRLHKAAAHANKLEALLQDREATKATDNDYLEARAYAQYLAGAEEFERQSSQRREDPAKAWRQCIVHFSEAHVIYTALLHGTHEDLYKEVIGATIDPSIRYAAYQSRLPRTTVIATVAKEHFPRNQVDLVSIVEKLNPAAFEEEQTALAAEVGAPDRSEAVPTSIEWRGRTAPIADAAIGQAMASTSTASAQLISISKGEVSNENTPKDTKALAAAYDPVLTAAQDTVDAVRRSILDLSKEGVPESDPRMQDLRVSDLAANYALVSWRVGRNRILISSEGTLDDGLEFQAEKRQIKKAKRSKSSTSSSKPESKARQMTRLTERVVLYDATLQSIDSVKDLRGAARDSAFMLELDGKRAYFHALKLMNIGYSHNVVGSHKEALALLAQAQSILKTADSSAFTDQSTNQPPTLKVSIAQSKKIVQYLDTLLLRQRGLVTLKQTMTEESGKTSAARPLPVSERLQEYPASGKVDLNNIVAWPPRMEPIPVKPIFLDLAWNYIKYPGTGHDEAESSEPEAEQMEGIVSGVVETAKQATEAVKEAVGGVAADDAKDTPKKRGWFSFGRG
jgi:signal recognition particle subunit SRP68